VGWGYLWLSMVSVKADVEAAGVGVSGLGLPVVVYDLCEGWCRGCRIWCKWGLGLPAVSMVSVKAGAEGARVGVSGLMVTCGCL